MPVVLLRPRAIAHRDDRLMSGVFEVGGKDLVAYWPLIPGRERFRDISGKGFHMTTLTGTPSEVRPGPFGDTAIGFDGSTNCAQSGSSPTAPSTAVSVFHLLAHANAGGSGSKFACGKNATGQGSWYFWTSTGTPVWRLRTAADTTFADVTHSGGSTGDGRWRPYVGSWDGTTSLLDVDGTVTSTTTVSGTWNAAGTALVTIGGTSTGTKGPFDHRHLAIINRALTQAERAYLRALFHGR